MYESQWKLTSDLNNVDVIYMLAWCMITLSLSSPALEYVLCKNDIPYFFTLLYSMLIESLHLCKFDSVRHYSP
jgi:hypothetical protein